MKILITGGRGFIGSHLVSILSSLGHDIFVLTHSLPPVDSHKINWIQINLMNPLGMDNMMQDIKPNVLICLAWYTEHGDFWNSRKNFDWINATKNIVTCFQKSGGKSVIMAGTCAEYDWSYGLCIEDLTPINPKSLYGKCKNYLHDWLDLFCGEFNISLIWARIFFPYGPGESNKKFIPTILNALATNEMPLKCSHGEQYRDFIHVRDVASALSHLLIADVNPGAYNICSGEPVKLSSIVYKCSEIFCITPSVEWGAVSVPKNDPFYLFGSNKKLADTGWRPSVTLEDGLREYVAEL